MRVLFLLALVGCAVPLTQVRNFPAPARYDCPRGAIMVAASEGAACMAEDHALQMPSLRHWRVVRCPYTGYAFWEYPDTVEVEYEGKPDVPFPSEADGRLP